MNIYQKESSRVVNAGYDVIKLAPAPQGGINLKDGDILDCNMRHYMIGSVISSCLKDGSDPIEGYERAKKLGHDIHFIFALGTCITGHKTEKKTYIHIEPDMIVNFEGHQFKLVRTNNDNFGLEIIK